jgi:uncharacterized membrane protein YccC
MRHDLARWRSLLASGPNIIALTTAVRGAIATATPLALLPPLGLGALAYPAVMGALATSMVDVGGPYRTRLIAMLLQTVGGPGLLLLGTLTVQRWWLAAPVMAAIALVSAIIRAVGPGGASLGINAAVAFLVGLQVGDVAGQAAPWPLGYGAGGVWTIVIALAFWRLRPYRRLEQEVAAAWEAAASLIAAAGETEDTVIARRRWERRLDARQTAFREAVDRARDSLGEMRAATAGPGTTIAQLVVLVNAAARIADAVIALTEVAGPSNAARLLAEAGLADAARGVARSLLSGKGTPPVPELRRRRDAARARGDAAYGDAAFLAWAQALRQFDNAAEAIELLFGARKRLSDLLRLPVAHRRPAGAVVGALRAHLSPRSAIFRHAARAATVTALETTVIAAYHLPHGIWLPLTSIVVLQPEYSGTVRRAVERGLGTIAGAVLAGVLLSLLHGTAAYDAALALLLFLTFLLIRRRYGYAMLFLTPLIILLIGMSSADPWIDLAERVAYTLVGAAVALAAGYVFWPQWEGEQLRDRLARAIRADKAYLDAVLGELAGAPAEETDALRLRNQAEVEVANADAGFQRMLGEPRRRTAPIAAGFALVLYLHRLCRHAIALSAQAGVAPVPADAVARLKTLLGAALEDAAQALTEGRPPAARPAFDAPLAALSGARGDAVPALFGRIVSDTTALINATNQAAQAAPSARGVEARARQQAASGRPERHAGG